MLPKREGAITLTRPSLRPLARSVVFQEAGVKALATVLSESHSAGVAADQKIYSGRKTRERISSLNAEH